jgi:hypothetical protein
MATYLEALEAIENYYGSGSDQWVEIAKYGIQADNAESILSQVPNINIIKNTNGSLRSFTYNATATANKTIASEINSNVATTAVKTSIPANMGVAETGKLTLKSGLSTAGSFVMTSVIPAIAAVGVGIKLGKTIDKAIYEWNPDYWDSKGLSGLDPDTWGSITEGDDSFRASLFNMILGIDSDTGETQSYIDENAMAYIAYYMQTTGMFKEETVVKDAPEGFPDVSDFLPIKVMNFDTSKLIFRMDDDSLWDVTRTGIGAAWCPSFRFSTRYDSEVGIIYNVNDTSESNQYTFNNKTVYYHIIGASYGYEYVKGLYTGVVNQSYKWSDLLKRKGELAWLIQYNSTSSAEIPGTGTQAGATTPKLDGLTSVADVLEALKEQYPEIWDKAVTQDIVQPDGSTTTYTYVPIGTPEADSADDTQPTTGKGTQSDSSVNPDTSTETLVDLMTKLISKIKTPSDTNTDSETGDGDTPTLIVPVGSASALYKIYNPTQEQLNSFGAWLWSNDFVDQLLKLFNDPMQAIIGLHKVYCPVPVGGSTTIKVGYLNSGVPSNYVSNQYTSVNCGSVSLSEYFGNVFDYDPYTKVHIYLPFIGIQELNVGDIMRSTISVTYHIDVLTGACLAEISVSRDGSGGILYTYTGNMAVQYPVSSGSYMGIVTALLGATATGMIGMTTGGAVMPAVMGIASQFMHPHSNVSHSGSFSGNAGAMGIKKPYLIITRPQTALAKTFPHNDGYPANYSTTIGKCSGYIEVESVHVENVPATEDELVEIERILKEGILV